MTFDYIEKNVHTPSFMKFYSQVDWNNRQILNMFTCIPVADSF